MNRTASTPWIRDYFRELLAAALGGWNRFWFEPSDPATLGLIRILGGGMIFYTHLVWTIDLLGFFGPGGWLELDALYQPEDRRWFWSHWNWIESPTLAWIAHLLALAVFLLLTLGWWTRAMSIAAYLLTVSYAHRASFVLFGLDDINAMLAMYLMIGPSGAAYSLDNLWRKRKQRLALSTAAAAGAGQGVGAETSLLQGRAGQGRAAEPLIEPRVGATIAIRLIQLHMCVIYFFSATGKLMGVSWWDGSAIWGAVANLEYQSWDMTWLASWPLLGSAVTHITLLWELSYPALVWPRLTRPLVIALAIPLHLGIALFLGMMTFGLAMIIGNLAFVSPWIVRALLDRRPPRVSGARMAESSC